jgi:hypothetical protein
MSCLSFVLGARHYAVVCYIVTCIDVAMLLLVVVVVVVAAV